MDFSYEVSRALSSCEGALLFIDVAQGIEAQTLANLYLAMENDLVIVPVINKIDLPSAELLMLLTELYLKPASVIPIFCASAVSCLLTAYIRLI